MGSRVSSNPGHRRSSFSFNFYHSFRQTWQRRRRQSRHQQEINREKRSSMHRPVLRLQVKTGTLERHKKNGNGLHLISKEKLQTLARESGMYDNLFPANRQSPPPLPRSRTPSGYRQSTASRDSMVIVQFVDDGPVNLGDGGRHDNGYDRLLPRGEFDHLCVCKYGRVNSDVINRQDDDSEERLPTISLGRQTSQPSVVSDSLRTDRLRDRILEHLEPYEPDPRFQRSTSMSALTTLQVTDIVSGARRRQVQSTSYLDEDIGGWSLGESIMRTLSRGDIHLFDIDNPKHESEKEVHRTWPKLKDKLRKWRQSQESLNQLDTDSEGVFSDSGCVSTPPNGRVSAPLRTTDRYL